MSVPIFLMHCLVPGSHFVYKRLQIDQMIASAASIGPRTVFSLGLGKAVHAARALLSLNVTGQRVVVFGSTTPRWETMCLALGAAEVWTVEYNNLTYDHPQLHTVTVREYVSQRPLLLGTFDLALSVSSFDHDGLGRYGDPVCPDGDLLAMDDAQGLLRRPTGRLIVSVPVSEDIVVWNLHRVYGPVRLPLLLHGWREVSRFGVTDSMFVKGRNSKSATNSPEPAFVLEVPATAPLAAEL